MNSPNGLGNRLRNTQSSRRHAAAETVSLLRGGLSEKDFGDQWGVSPATVGNAQNSKNDLSLENFLKLGERFGPEGVNKVLALIGMTAVASEAVEVDIAAMPQEFAEMLPVLIKLWTDGENCDSDMRELDALGVTDKLIRLGDYMRNCRAGIRPLATTPELKNVKEN